MALIGGLVLAALLIIDPVALARLGYACAVGGCGIRPVWLAAGAGAVLLIVLLRGRLVRRRPPVRTPVGKPRQPAKARRAGAPATLARRPPRRTAAKP